MSKSKRTEIPDQQLELILRALADPHRYEILKRLCRSEEAFPCSSVRECFAISAATLSHHMRELELAGLIEVVRDGKFRSYLPHRDVLKAFLKQMRRDLAKESN